MFRLRSLSIMLVTSMFGIGSVSSAQTTQPSVTLRQAAADNFLFGCAISPRELDDPKHAELIATQFNAVTAGNEMKPDALQRVKGKFTFEQADKLVDFAQKHDMKVIGHTLLWHSQAPKWLFEDESGKPLPREEALENLRTHIHTVMKHFRGRVHGWDVINEAIDDGGPYLRNTPALRAIGEDYIVKAFQFAREADPDAELYYNDYNIEADYKRPKAVRLLKELEAAGVKPDALGIQGHWLLEKPDIAEIERGLTTFRDMGYKMMLTEVDVDVLPRRGAGADVTERNAAAANPYTAGLPDDVQQKLARRYEELFEMLRRYDGHITRVTLWGTHDGNSWLNFWPTPGRTNHPLLFDRQYQPKPAFFSVIKVLER